MINGERAVFFEKRGRLERLPDVTIPEKSLQVAARNIARSLLVGEVRGSEAFDLLQAMNTGHQGTLSTIHANSGEETLARFATCVMMAGIELPHRTVRANIADALDLIVHIERRNGKRYVNEVLRVKGYGRGFGTVLLQLDIYIGVSRFFWTVCKLESGLESRSSDSGA